jgi:hypothetical protein
LDEVGMDLARGLELEQRYIALLDAGESFDALRAARRPRRRPARRVRPP